jgi:thioesterase domain-containing protein
MAEDRTNTPPGGRAASRRQKAQLDTGPVDRRQHRGGRNAADAESDLAAHFNKKDREAFFDLLRPLLQNLRKHAASELTIGEAEESLRPNDLTVDDLLDEVLVAAWEKWRDRPPTQRLDAWLLQLLHEVLEKNGFAPPDEGKKPKTRGDGNFKR